MKIFYLLLLSIVAISCSKETVEENPGLVSVRIINETGVTMENAQVAGVSFGSILPGFPTEFKVMENLIYAAHCEFFNAGNLIYAGFWICGTPMPDPFAAGKYTFRVTVPNPGQYYIEVTRD